MYKQLLVLAMASAVTTTGWTADKNRASKQEAMGVGSGAVIGAAAGGPVGFVLGAALGGWLGDRFHDERTQRIDAEGRYAAARADAETLETLLARNEREIARVVAQLESERRSHSRSLEEALNVQVYFRTARTELDPGAAERLTRIGELIKPMDGVVVLLEGHADARGDEQYNEALSAARAEAVRQIFIDAGVPADRIAVSAEGETFAVATPEDVDALALERRVEISIIGPGHGERVAHEH
jgi:outer membrane protein OmpA-like peptidoglycan-associated protein